jgi:succinate dehydrogenase/fumarate reductase flavoprotein subunit
LRQPAVITIKEKAMSSNRKGPNPVSRRSFLKTTVTKGTAGIAVAAAGLQPRKAEAADFKWDRTADVVVVGAGVSGLACACAASDTGASVIMVEENFDIGGRGIMSGGSIQLGGGHSLQKKYGTVDSADMIFADWTRHDHPASRYSDRDIVRKFADENAATFEFLLAHGVQFTGREEEGSGASTNAGRTYQTVEWQIPSQVIAPHRGRNGSGLVRRLEESARKAGVQILLRHSMTKIIRESPLAGRVLGITARYVGKDINIRARKGVFVGTGGNCGNVNFRRTFDPRLTDEYQQACAPYCRQSGDAEVSSMAIGASLWATALQTSESGAAMTRTTHIGCQWGYGQLVFETDSPIFHLARATGLTVASWQDVILVNQAGKRFWNELDGGYDFIAAAMAYNGDPDKLNGGGPIWAIFDADAVVREKWNPQPPNVDPLYFASGATLKELAANIKNPYQKRRMPGTVLQETVERYNSFVTSGVDADFKKPKPMYTIEKPPFYAAWATPILHDSLTGLRVNTDQQVIDIFGKVIPGLYTGGESMGGLAQHGLGRDLVSGRIAGLHAGRSPSVNT